MLQERSHIRAVHIAGKEVRIAERGYDPRQVTDFALSNWTELYTRARVAELNRQQSAARRRIVWKPRPGGKERARSGGASLETAASQPSDEDRPNSIKTSLMARSARRAAPNHTQPWLVLHGLEGRAEGAERGRGARRGLQDASAPRPPSSRRDRRRINRSGAPADGPLSTTCPVRVTHRRGRRSPMPCWFLSADHEDRRPFVDLADDVKDLLDISRRQSHRRLVHAQQFGVRHQRPADRNHLLLAARQRAGELAQPLLDPRKEREDVRDRRRIAFRAGACRRPFRGFRRPSCAETAAAPRAPGQCRGAPVRRC